MAEKVLQSVGRAFQVLECLANHGELGIREIHTLTGYSVAAIHRILTTLTGLSYVQQNPDTTRYELTYKVMVLGHSVFRHNKTIQLVHPLMEQLYARTEATVHFAERAGNKIRYLDKVTPPTGVVGMTSFLGMELPMYSTSIGKAILADLPDGEVEAIWNSEKPEAFTPNTITSWEELMVRLEQTRKTGLAYDYGEREIGVSCMAVDVLDGGGRPVYALSISSTDARMRENHDRYAVLLKEAKLQLTELIGSSGSDKAK